MSQPPLIYFSSIDKPYMHPQEIKITNKVNNISKKNRQRRKKIKNRFFLMPMDGPVNPKSGNGDGDLGFKYMSVNSKYRIPSILPDSPSPSVDKKSAAADTATPRKKNFGHRSFSRVLKALLFEASLIKKLRKRKLRAKLKEKTVKNSEISMSNNPEENSNGRRSISNSSSLFRSSSVIPSSSMCSLCGSSLAYRNNSNKSSFRSSSSEQKKLPDNVNNVQEQGKGYYGVNFGLCLFVLSLVVLVFWGKVCAIFCTSTWLFFVPRRSIGSDSRNGDSWEFDSEQYKKKIIMEGLLERKSLDDNLVGYISNFRACGARGS